MTVATPEAPTADSPAAGRCPVNQRAYSHQKTAKDYEPADAPIVERDAAGVWHVRGFEAARQVLRHADTRQAGFKAELLEQMPGQQNKPILYQEGKEHLLQRKQTARFFTPTTTSAKYRALMEKLADELVAELRAKRRGDLSQLSMRLAVAVASEVVGLTDSRRAGIDRRLDAFFSGNIGEPGRSPRALWAFLRNQLRMLAFFYFDVKPAITARRKARQADVISHLIDQNYSDSAILIECVTYGAAGMVTTREFISVCAWHLLEQPELRARYLAAGEPERHAILNEILRVEPVVAHLFRRATGDLEVQAGGQAVTIPAGGLVDLHIYATNADESVVGAEPLAICPGRELRAEKATAPLLSFGDGYHRCPGGYIALQETDLFLQRLLALPGLRIERAPTLSWAELSQSYELRQFILALD
ncbi:MAG: cytochrome P450 [Anaerolineales bacterium]|nr:cytochrome P450 [Anaerolineales bacterium]